MLQNQHTFPDTYISVQPGSVGANPPPSSLFGSASSTAVASQFKFNPSSAATVPTVKTPSFSSFNPPTNQPTKDEPELAFYSSMRGLNHSLLKSLQEATGADPFADLRKILEEALTKYTSHYATIQKILSPTDTPEKASPTENVPAPSTPTPVMPSPPTTGFSFGGKTLTQTRSTSGTDKSSGPAGFVFKPPATSTPSAQTGSHATLTTTAPSALVFSPPSTALDPKADKDKGIASSTPSESQPVSEAPVENPFLASKESKSPVDGSKMTEPSLQQAPSVSASTYGTSAFGSSAFGSRKSAFSFGSDARPPQPVRAQDKTEEGPDGTTSPLGDVGNSSTINAAHVSKADSTSDSSSGPFGVPLKDSVNPLPINHTTEDGNESAAAGTPASGSTLFGGASKGFAFSSSPSSAFNKGTSGSSPFGGFSTTAGALAFQAPKGNGTSDGNATTVKFGTFPKPSAFGTSPFGTASPFAAPPSKNPFSFGSSSPKTFNTPVGFGFGTPPKEPKSLESAGSSKDETDNSAPEAGDSGEIAASVDTESSADPLASGDDDAEGEGEESEITVYTGRSKLLRFTDGEWRPLGVGFFKIKKNKDTEKKRVLFRLGGSKKVAAVR